jgi:hypothetical protein
MSKVVFVKTSISFPHGTSRAAMIARFQGLDVFKGQEIPAPSSLSPDKFDHVWTGKKVKLVTKVGRRKVLLTARIDGGIIPGMHAWEERIEYRWQVNVE